MPDTVKRDSVNRVDGLVHLSRDRMSVANIYVGKRLDARYFQIEETPVDFVDSSRDAMVMTEGRDGDAVGDAIFDAQLVEPSGHTFDAMDV